MNPQNPKQTRPGTSGEQDESRRGQPSGGAGRSGQESSGNQPDSSPKTGSGSSTKGRESGPRYDDRPKSDREGELREENEGPAGSTTKPADQRAREAGDPRRKTGTGGLPEYGDREPGDPRRTDVEGDSESED